jgi:hypothetical protein
LEIVAELERSLASAAGIATARSYGPGSRPLVAQAVIMPKE